MCGVHSFPSVCFISNLSRYLSNSPAFCIVVADRRSSYIFHHTGTVQAIFSWRASFQHNDMHVCTMIYFIIMIQFKPFSFSEPASNIKLCMCTLCTTSSRWYDLFKESKVKINLFWAKQSHGAIIIYKNVHFHLISTQGRT